MDIQKIVREIISDKDSHSAIVFRNTNDGQVSIALAVHEGHAGVSDIAAILAAGCELLKKFVIDQVNPDNPLVEGLTSIQSSLEFIATSSALISAVSGVDKSELN